MPSRVTELSHNSLDSINQRWKGSSSSVDTRDELMISLLASEEMLDSRDYDILSAEEVEDLKQQRELLDARMSTMAKKLSLETKIRDAAASLAKVNSAHKSVSKQTSDQLESANRKVDAAQKEFWKLSERWNEINKKLLEHRAGVLSCSLRIQQRKLGGDASGGTPNASIQGTRMSASPSETSQMSSSQSRFEGLHLFAGHANAITPKPPRKPPSIAEYTALEDRLKEVTSQLEAASGAQVELKRENSRLQTEKAQAETSMNSKLRATEEKVSSLQIEVDRLRNGQLDAAEFASERDQWEMDRAVKQQEIDRLQNRLQEVQEKGEEDLGMEMKMVELEAALDALRSVIHSQGIADISADLPVIEQVNALADHLDEVKSRLQERDLDRQEWLLQRSKLEDELKASLTKREELSRQVNNLGKERDEVKKQSKILESRISTQSRPPSTTESFSRPQSNGGALEGTPGVKKFFAALQPVWNALPSPEARASKFGQRSKGSPIQAPGSPNTSLSELDVRLLKTLYDGRPAYQTVDTSSAFTVEAFAARVQALIADDRALIERLIRFAQAHDLLKKNAERAQKIALDSSVALETYQKQVKVLEERNSTLAASIGALQDEIHELQETIEKVMAEKQDVETHAAEQAEMCRELNEANVSLSARTLALAEEAANAPEAMRKQYETQLSQCKADLEKAQDELHSIRTSEQTQRIALLDELNSLQSDNTNLRNQLRARK
ncbi:hypothetical protein SCHPADRAFT_817661 [Schizopora paradoxa]|uniref:Up-regulated during septation protein 1 domain-containing protein n=1 Tax=Schizopora paradoxa TaxID=27342 RepID=A0A0H2S6G2_9AGAM|nr:hypothetical protein SCHPADRAFT_817661 [Schizopora paradoxa]